MMEQNVGMADRYIRIALGSLMVAMGAARMARRPETGAAVVGLLGGTMLAEGVLGTCPLYSLMGVSTNREASHYRDDGEQPPPGERTNDEILPYEGI